MRLFIAINFEERIKDEIQSIAKEVKESSIKGKFVNKEHIHLTLEFLGDIHSNRVEEIKDIMNKIEFEPFTMELENIGFFKRRDGNIYWLGIKHSEKLLELQSRLHRLLLEKGFKLEDRAYKPHITLGRRVNVKDDFDMENLSNSVQDISIFVDKIDLMKSEHINGKLVYSIV